MDRNPAAAPIHIEQLRDNLYVLRGGGRTIEVAGTTLPTAGTSAVLVTERGVVVVDTKLPGCGAPILARIREISARPVTMIINTHAHFDHVGSNPEFPEDVEVIAHENTARLMREMRPVSGGPAQPDLFAQSGRGLPTRTFPDSLAIGSGRDRIELHWFGRAHTSGDAWVVFPELRVVHAGDAFAHKAVPPLDINNGASGIDYPRTLARAAAALRDVDTVITGHYPAVLGREDLVTYAAFIREFVEAVQDAKRSGRTIDDFLGTWSLPRQRVEQGYVDFSHLRSIRPDVEVIWNELQG